MHVYSRLLSTGYIQDSHIHSVYLHDTIPVSKNLFKVSKITLGQKSLLPWHYFSDFEQVFAHWNVYMIIYNYNSKSLPCQEKHGQKSAQLMLEQGILL